jgi:hypothetical protein
VLWINLDEIGVGLVTFPRTLLSQFFFFQDCKFTPIYKLHSDTIFRHVCIVTKSAHYLLYVHPSLCSAVCLSTCISMAPTGWISMKFDIGDFHENLLRNFNLVKNRQKYQAHLCEDLHKLYYCRWQTYFCATLSIFVLLAVTCSSSVILTECIVAFPLQEWVPYFPVDNAHPKLFWHSFWCIDNAHPKLFQHSFWCIDNAHLMYNAHPKLFWHSFWCIDMRMTLTTIFYGL